MRTQCSFVTTASLRFRHFYRLRHLLFELIKREVQQKYTGSALGVAWLFIQPVTFVSVLYLIFTVGIRPSITADGPFALFLICGMVPWLLFAENFNGTASLFKGYSFLLKRADFPLGLLPAIKLTSSLVPHFALVALLLVAVLLATDSLTLYFIQLFYYLGCCILLLFGAGWITASLGLFLRDMQHATGVIVQFGFWLTPILWPLDSLPPEYRWIIQANPMCYIVEGYRDSVYRAIPFWEKPTQTFYFLAFATFLAASGLSLYRRLRPHFAEVV